MQVQFWTAFGANAGKFLMNWQNTNFDCFIWSLHQGLGALDHPDKPGDDVGDKLNCLTASFWFCFGYCLHGSDHFFVKSE